VVVLAALCMIQALSLLSKSLKNRRYDLPSRSCQSEAFHLMLHSISCQLDAVLAKTGLSL